MIIILVAVPLTPGTMDRLNEIPEFEVHEKSGLTPRQLAMEAGDADALVLGGSFPVGKEILAAGAGLKLIVGGELDETSMAKARQRGIEVRPAAGGAAGGDDTVAILKDFFNV
ncbi:MAG: hypothetical protein JXO51_01870 [Candidatus Aminicenantes bacterium]|nr:hypothetical protein [Candidatus Aminicenantes bacterium]